MTDLSLVPTTELVGALRARHDHTIIACGVDQANGKVQMAVWIDGDPTDIGNMILTIARVEAAKRLGADPGVDHSSPTDGPFDGVARE